MFCCKHCQRNGCPRSTTHFRKDRGVNRGVGVQLCRRKLGVNPSTNRKHSIFTNWLQHRKRIFPGTLSNHFVNKYFQPFRGFWWESFKASPPTGATPINHSLCQRYVEPQGNPHQLIKSSDHQAPRRQRGRRKLKYVQLLLSLEDLFEPLSVF